MITLGAARWDLLMSFHETFENRMERSLSILGGFWRLAVVNTLWAVVCVQERRHISVHNGMAVSMGSNRRSCNYFVEEREREREKERERERERAEGQEEEEKRRNGLNGVLFYRGVMEISTDVMPPLRLSLRHCNISPFSSLLPSMISSIFTRRTTQQTIFTSVITEHLGNPLLYISFSLKGSPSPLPLPIP